MRVRHLSITLTSTVAKEETHEQTHPATGFSLLALAGTNAWADHLVAIAGPMTGQYASAGDQIRKGAEMAIADINAKGGVSARS
jgi:ABC-type branched-subunit amino acid transport system substrate-binding protein